MDGFDKSPVTLDRFRLFTAPWDELSEKKRVIALMELRRCVEAKVEKFRDGMLRDGEDQRPFTPESYFQLVIRGWEDVEREEEEGAVGYWKEQARDGLLLSDPRYVAARRSFVGILAVGRSTVNRARQVIADATGTEPDAWRFVSLGPDGRHFLPLFAHTSEPRMSVALLDNQDCSLAAKWAREGMTDLDAFEEVPAHLRSAAAVAECIDLDDGEIVEVDGRTRVITGPVEELDTLPGLG